MAEVRSFTSPPPSRYRSQRQKHASIEAEQQQREREQQHGAAGDGGLARSQSRYHRKQGGTAVSPLETRPASQETPARYHSKHRSSPLKPLYQEQVVQAPRLQATRTTSSENYTTNVSHVATPPAGLGAHDPSRHISSDDERDSEVDSRQHSRDRPSRTRSNEQPQTTTLPLYRHPEGLAVTGELFPRPMEVAEPIRHDGPPQSGHIRATQSLSELPQYPVNENTGCFGGLFKRRRGDATSGTVSKSAITRPAAAKHNEPIRPGGGGAVPGIDAPKSAVNAGDRKVLVECRKEQRWFSVTPETTSTDIIKTAAAVMSERIDIRSALLVEIFRSVGVQRPLRRYEQIRDVLNSWDDDAQNMLILVEPGAGTIEPELTITGAPMDRPEGDTWLMTSSYRPGKWENRYVTLKPDGQIVQQKDLDKPKDVSNVCHLSDFDIYTPTTERKKGKIKPPKKYCFAIKSQQKTTMFESTEDYVHFFCTADPVTSDSFYKAVQSYRSWYLVNVRGEGRKEKPKAAPVLPAVPSQNSGERIDRQTSTDSTQHHRVHESLDSHYQLGSFKPLVDFATFEQRPPSESNSDKVGSGGFAKSADQFNTNAPLEKRSNTVKLSHPPGAMANRGVLDEDEPLANLGRSTSVSKRRSTDQNRPNTSEFKDSGLLGRSYSQRRKENERDAERQGREDYLGNSSERLQLTSSTRKHHSSGGDMPRSSSTRDPNRSGGGPGQLDRSASRSRRPPGLMGKPLIDLTPEYKEPPQFKSKGRGHKPDRLGAGGLIEAATTPEDPLNIPQNTIFRNNASGQHHHTGTMPGHSQGLVNITPQHKEPVHHAVRKGPAITTMSDARNASHGSQPSREGFTGEGLLASGRQGWGTGDKGRGVIDGNRAGGKPLVDFSGESQYSKGSLLNKVEKAQGGPLPIPIIDREKRDD